MPVCKTCKVEKPQEEFHLRRETGAYRTVCKICWTDSRACRDFGITREELLLMEYGVGGKCQICGRSPEEIGHSRTNRLCIDHEHASGVIRGLLCGNCNTALGLMADDPMRLRKAAEYLEGKCPTPRQVIADKTLKGLD